VFFDEKRPSDFRGSTKLAEIVVEGGVKGATKLFASSSILTHLGGETLRNTNSVKPQLLQMHLNVNAD